MPESAQESQNSSDFGGRGRGVREVTSIQSQARPNLRPHPNVDSAAQCLSSPPTLPDRDLNSLIAEKVAALRTEAGLSTILDGIGDGFYAVHRDLAHHLVQRSGGEAFSPRTRPDARPHPVGGVCPARAKPRSARTAPCGVMASRAFIRSET